MHKLVTIIVLAFMVLIPNQAYAQSLPTNSTPIQRTIEEEGAQSFSEPVSSANRRANNSTLYGLVATGLALIAAGAVYLMWVQSKPRN